MKKAANYVLLAWLWACSAHAGRMLPLSIEQLTQKADLVLHGTVQSMKVQRDDSGRIFTRVELNVVEAWKGRPQANPFVLVHSGGVLGEEVAATEDQVELTVSEEVVLFLRLNERGEGVVIGMLQGKFRVARDANEKVVHNVFHGSAPGANSD